MAYRKRKDDSDVSDDEDKPHLKDDGDDEYEPKQKRVAVWTDVEVGRQLESQSSKINLDRGNPDKKFQRVSRGAETYHVPAGESYPRTNVDKREIPVVTVTPVTDDLFGDYVDIAAVEEFGVGPSVPPRGRGRGSGAGFRGRGRGRGRFNNGQDSAMDTSNTGGAENGEESRPGERKPRPDGWMRGRGRGQYWQHRGGNRGRGGYFPGQKRNFAGDPAHLVTPDYSLEALMSTEFQQGTPLDQLGKELAQALGEKDPTTVVAIVTAIGEEKALKLLEETREIETKGGMKTMDGSRRRTPGGVFISLFKTDIDVSPEIKDKIFEKSKIEQRRIHKARRRNFENNLKVVADLMKKEKDGGELKPLPDVTEVLATPAAKPEDVTMES